MLTAELDPSGHEPRTVCYDCFRPTALCYCRFLKPVDNRTPVLILQHPRERFHPIGTARIAQRSLRRASIIVDNDFRLRNGERSLELAPGAGLLFPGPGARDLGAVPKHEHPNSLVVLDGTWHQARTLYREIEALHLLPKFCFSSAQPSQYRIRKEPSVECVSTIEAIVHALHLIEPETEGLEGMLHTFKRMIDLQISAVGARDRIPRFKLRETPTPHPLPSFLTDAFERVVIVYGESAVTGPELESVSRREARRGNKEVIYWVARRLRDDATFSAVVRPSASLAERRRCPMGLTPGDLEAGCKIEQAQAEWRAFCQPDDLVLTWNKSTLNMLEKMRHRGESSYLKSIYWNLERRRGEASEKRGSIEEIVEREGLEVCETQLLGRAGTRLAQLEALTRLVHLRGRKFAPASAP